MRVWSCPKCELQVHPGSTVCPSCKIAIAQCAWCRDLTSVTPVEPARGAHRERIKCDKCGRLGAKCRTGLLGGYCSGLTQAEGKIGRQFCAPCTAGLYNAGKTVAAWTLIGLIAGRLRPRG